MKIYICKTVINVYMTATVQLLSQKVDAAKNDSKALTALQHTHRQNNTHRPKLLKTHPSC